MNAAAVAPAREAADWPHAAQLGAAVVIAWGASALLHLPEGFWAVMSALIVLRPTAGATLGAGWDRVRGTVAGTLIGLAGIGLRHVPGTEGPLATLAIVVLLAAAGALVPWLRSAPITALIVLGSAGAAHHSALQVAALRATEIGIGIATGALLSLASLRRPTGRRFDAACARALRRIAAQVRRDFGDPLPEPAEREGQTAELRQTLRALAVQAVGVEREARLMARLCRQPAASEPVRAARIVARTLHDATLFTRLAAARRAEEPEPDYAAIRDAIAGALEATADHLAAGTPLGETLLREHARRAVAAARGAAWVQPAARLVMQDLAALSRR